MGRFLLGVGVPPSVLSVSRRVAGSDQVQEALARSLNDALKTLTSLNKEIRPFFLGDNSIWNFSSVSSLSDYSIWSSCRLKYILALRS